MYSRDQLLCCMALNFLVRFCSIYFHYWQWYVTSKMDERIIIILVSRDQVIGVYPAIDSTESDKYIVTEINS